MRLLEIQEMQQITGGDLAGTCSAIAGITTGMLFLGNIGGAAIGGAAFILLCVNGG